MGTLFDQQPRDYKTVSPDHIEAFIDDAARIAKKYKLSVAEVIESAKVLEMERQNSLYAANGDAWDEQLAGFGELLSRLASAVEDLKGSE